MNDAEFAEDFAGSPDGFERLWTPHRSIYLDQNRAAPATRCAFCYAPERPDAEGLVVARGDLAFVVMNLYPYNSGHVLVCPYRHVAMYDEIFATEAAEISALTQSAMRVLRAVTGCAGFNLGMNQGEVAGAGIAGHLHQHVVPRWPMDTNFFPIVAQTRAVAGIIADQRDRLAAAWLQYASGPV